MYFFILLCISITFEVIGVTFLYLANGFSVFLPSVLAIFFYCSSIAIYILLTAKREVGIVNAIFAGTGTAMVAIIGILFFNETLSAVKLIGIGLIIGGAVAINLKPSKEQELV